MYFLFLEQKKILPAETFKLKVCLSAVTCVLTCQLLSLDLDLDGLKLQLVQAETGECRQTATGCSDTVKVDTGILWV